MGVALDLSLALDPAMWAEAAAGFELDPWQADVLRTDAGGVLMNCCRQSGKSTVAALLALHEALYRPETLALLLSPSLRQSSELFRKVATFYEGMADPICADAESALRIELVNGSRVVSLPGKEQTVRGYSGVDLLIIDEAARTCDGLYLAVRPMLAVSGGRLVALSTPFGKRGWWFTEWTEGGDGWKRVKVTARDCPRISDEFLEQERKHLGQFWYDQEYEVKFLDAESAAFTWEMVKSATVEEVEVWML
jgi:hypothetical protein